MVVVDDIDDYGLECVNEFKRILVMDDGEMGEVGLDNNDGNDLKCVDKFERIVVIDDSVKEGSILP